MKVSRTHHVTKTGAVKKNPSRNVEYVLWATRDGVEQPLRVNGQETHTNREEVLRMKQALDKRGDFDSIRIQTINLGSGYDAGAEFARAVR
jgi:hypothetical protein